jgi:starch phosphorylase
MLGKRFTIEYQPDIPKTLSRLPEIANDLYYSWNSEVRILFRRLDQELWEKCNHNPKLFLRRVSQQVLDCASLDSSFIKDYNRLLSGYTAYQNLEISPILSKTIDSESDFIAYFCLEFGFHESFKVYSGGLGILAADLCKAASDMAVPFVAVGLLYRQGYFGQEIDNYGRQVAKYYPAKFDQLPITECKNESGEALYVEVNFQNRVVKLKVWQAIAGNIKLYFLDSDIPENTEEDRKITYQLYGGDRETRILQEIVLGIGGVRALRKVGHNPTIWHINEGHASFSIIERCRERVAQGLDFDSALELVASSTVFTTHTPVPAGHDIFDEGLIHKYFNEYVKELKIDFKKYQALGQGNGSHGFNMTTLALRCSRFHNGVSKVHGSVASDMEKYVWPQIDPKENPIDYVTNGVHIHTFLAPEWSNLFDMRFGNWRSELNNEQFWQCLDDIPAHRFWSLRRELKTTLLSDLYQRITKQCLRNGRSKSAINHITQLIHPHDKDLLILGFARRFATYKRATLLFNDSERLARLLNNPEKPVLIVIAGKAHPKDEPGQELIKAIHELTQRSEFQGKVILVEDYDMVLARRMVAGVDVWLNTPEYPLEASGTSGQKAGMNGVLNLSVLDGWWAEGYNGKNGWAITPHGKEFDHKYRNQQEATDLLDIIENEVIPAYYDRGTQGYSTAWISMARESMKSIIPKFNSQRMLVDYFNKLYVGAKKQSTLMGANNAELAKELSAWKSKIDKAWDGVRIKCISEKPYILKQREIYTFKVNVYLNGLSKDDVAIECIMSDEKKDELFDNYQIYKFEFEEQDSSGNSIFSLDLDPDASGVQYLRIRMYPYHKNLSHPFETGKTIWLDK